MADDYTLHGFSDLAPFILAIDPTASGGQKLKTVLTDPPRGFASGDIPFAYLSLAPGKRWGGGRQANTSVITKYSIKITLVLDMYDAGMGEPQNHKAILPWVKALIFAIKRHVRLGDTVNRIYVSPQGGDDELVTGLPYAREYQGVGTCVVMEAIVDIDEHTIGVISDQ